MTCRPCRLPDGTWGARVPPGVAVGDRLRVVDPRGSGWVVVVRVLRSLPGRAALVRVRPHGK